MNGDGRRGRAPSVQVRPACSNLQPKLGWRFPWAPRKELFLISGTPRSVAQVRTEQLTSPCIFQRPRTGFTSTDTVY